MNIKISNAIYYYFGVLYVIVIGSFVNAYENLFYELNLFYLFAFALITIIGFIVIGGVGMLIGLLIEDYVDCLV